MSDPVSARRFGHASLGMSVAGVVIVVVLIIIVCAVVFNSCGGSRYEYDGVCYDSRSYVGTDGYCSGVRHGNYCYYYYY